MAPRIRYIFASDEIPHLYAAHNSPHPNGASVSRAANAHRNRSFDGPTLWSYSTIVANVVTLPATRTRPALPILLLSSRTYSVTTSRFTSDVWHAVSFDRFVVPNVGASGHIYASDHAANLAYFRSLVEDAKGRAERSRMFKDDCFREAAIIMRRARDYCATFGVSPRGFPPREIADLERRVNDAAEAMTARRRVALDKRAEASRAATARYEAQAAKAMPEKIADWLAGRFASLPYHAPTLLRREGVTVKTSKGAVVPFDAAVSLYNSLCRVVGAAHPEIAGKWAAGIVGRHIGPYTIGRVGMAAGGEIAIGCHVIRYAEIERFARAEGFAGSVALAEPATYAGEG